MADSLRPAYEAILRLADRLEPTLRDAFLRAVGRVSTHIDVSALSAALRDRNAARANVLIGGDRLSGELGPTTRVVDSAFAAGGSIAARQLGPVIGAALRFDLANPAASAFAAAQAGRLVTNVTSETRLAIRVFVQRAIDDGLTMQQTARLIRPVVGLTERQANALMNYRATLAKTGLNDANVAVKAGRYGEQLLRRRATTIARTELIEASNRGQQALWEQAVRHGHLPADVEQQWITTPDDRLCPTCAALHGQKRRLGEMFISPIDGRRAIAPPLHPNCRCALVLARMANALREAA